MRNFAAAWPDPEILQQLLQNLAWGHNLVLLDRLDDAHTRRWYAQRAVTDGWSRAIPTDRITPTSSSSSRPQPSLRLTSPPNSPSGQATANAAFVHLGVTALGRLLR